jgi:hypothetical protein
LVIPGRAKREPEIQRATCKGGQVDSNAHQSSPLRRPQVRNCAPGNDEQREIRPEKQPRKKGRLNEQAAQV